MALSYRKTEKGIAEIATRANGLTPRLRQALIVVDGQRNEHELRALISQDAEGVLATLLAQGFIEAHGTVRGAPPPAEPAARAAPDWQEQRRKAVRFLNEHLGPTAESLVLKIEKCGSIHELGPHLEVAEGFLRSARGVAVAREFAARFLKGDPAG